MDYLVAKIILFLFPLRLRALYRGLKITTMSCNCNKSQPLPSCISNLVIGEVADISADYYAVLKTANGTWLYDTFLLYNTSTLAIEDFNVRIGHVYEISISNKADANIETKTDFTIEGQTVQCVSVEFYQSDASINSQTLTLQP